MKKVCFTIISIMLIHCAFSQKQRQNLRTDVFALNSCSPTQVSIFRDSQQLNKIVYNNKLSLNANRFSAFKVTNINPLRYSYNISNQSVSQFFDAADIILGSLTRDTANLVIDSIEVLQIFNNDTAARQREKLNLSKSKINTYLNQLDSLTNAFDKISITGNYDSIANNFRGSSSQVSNYTVLNKNINVANKKISQDLQDQLDTFRSIIEGATINNNSQDLLKDIIAINDTSLLTEGKLRPIAKAIREQTIYTKEGLTQLDSLLGMLPSLLSHLSYENVYDSNRISDANIIKLIHRIVNAKFYTSNKAFTVEFNQLKYGTDIEKRLEIYRVEKFTSDEKVKVAEAFVVFTSLQMGKLLQNEIIDCSRFQNVLKLEDCISDSFRARLNENRNHDTLLYRYIENISADLNVFIKFLQLDNPAFNNTVKKINDNYKILLKFIKTLDFVSKNNSEKFQLPVHSNLKNVDLIRYSIDRRDKLTGKAETYTYDLWLKGGLKVDFSVAILMSRLIDDVYNKDAMFSKAVFDSATGNYNTTQRTDSLYLKKADNGKYNFAFGGMVNVMWRTGASWITPGASIGIAYGAATNSKLQFTGALSFQFGKTERLIVHFGLVAGQAQVIDVSQLTYDPAKDVSDKENTYKVKGDFSTMTVPLTYQFKFKPFFGISYNLSKKNALTAVGTNANNFKSASAPN